MTSALRYGDFLNYRIENCKVLATNKKENETGPDGYKTVSSRFLFFFPPVVCQVLRGYNELSKERWKDHGAR